MRMKYEAALRQWEYTVETVGVALYRNTARRQEFYRRAGVEV